MNEFIPYGRQTIDEEDIQAVAEVLRSDWITQGPLIEKFERALCKRFSVPYAVVVSNGTAALHLAALAVGIQPGDRVVTTPNTFIATANCVRYCGGEVVFVDIDPQTYNLSAEKLEAFLSQPENRKGLKGIIAVHFAGQPCDLEKISFLAEKYGLWVLEDAAHAAGARWRNGKEEWQTVGACTHSEITTFSFHPVKHFTTGEGGAILTRRQDLYEKLLELRNHGITRNPGRLTRNEVSETLQGPWYYECQSLGFNYRLTDFQCALGISQLKKLDPWLRRRREIAKIYDRELAAYEKVVRPFVRRDVEHAYHLYVVQVPERREVFERLRENGIGVQVHYIPLPRHPLYAKERETLPETDRYYRNCLSLPIYPAMTNDQALHVVRQLGAILSDLDSESSTQSEPFSLKKKRLKVGAIIQARMGSTRLPGKVLMSLAGKPVLQHVIERVQACKPLDVVIVATTRETADDPVAKLAHRLSCQVFRGDEEDVLGRYFGAAQEFKLDVIVRITSDCPVIDPEIISAMMKQFLQGGWDYLNNTLKRTYPRGLDVEIFSFDALRRAHLEDKRMDRREHVTPYLCQHPEKFRIESFMDSEDHSDIRLTLDTKEDLALLTQVFESLYPQNPNFRYADILRLFEKQPGLREMNAEVRQKEIAL